MRLGELPVMMPGPRAKQRDAFHPDQPRQRILIHHEIGS